MLRWGTSPEQLWDVASTVCTRLTARPPPITSWPTQYPDFERRIACFGMDWLGRQLSLDPTRGRHDDPEVLLLDVGAGEALEIPTAFTQSHDSELTEFTDAALAATFFDQWLEAHPAAIQFDQCVGYNVPLFLGGVDGVENLDVTDVDVYWTLTGQRRVAALGHS